MKQIEKHPAVRERTVGSISRLERASKIIGQHQKKYDGSGYPRGWGGEEIILEARILAVVDAWNAMVTDRPYRNSLPEEGAIKELNKNAGSQFDPEVLETFLEMV